MELPCGFGGLCHAVGHARMLLPIDRDTTQFLEENTEWEEEPFLLHEEVALHAASTNIQLSYQEVPVAGVRSQADNKLIGMVLRYFGSPSQMFVQVPITKTFPHDYELIWSRISPISALYFSLRSLK